MTSPRPPSVLGRAIRVAAISLVSLHLGLNLARAVPIDGLWRDVDEAFGRLPTALHMYGRWEMFSMPKRPKNAISGYIRAEIELADGSTEIVGTPRPEGQSLEQWWRDRRWSQVSRWLNKERNRRRHEATVLRVLCREASEAGKDPVKASLVRMAANPKHGLEARRSVLIERNCPRDTTKGDSP